jgi:hypothetical protein
MEVKPNLRAVNKRHREKLMPTNINRQVRGHFDAASEKFGERIGRERS